MKIELKNIEISEAGDEYFQVVFEEKKATDLNYKLDNKYILIQRQFELPDNDDIYIENQTFDYGGHYKIVKAELTPRKLHLKLKNTKHSNLEILFKASDSKYEKLSRALKTIIPEIIIKKC